MITNDDGIGADGLLRLARAAADYGEVTVVAPAGQCSAMSHRITLLQPLDVWKTAFDVEGVRAYRLEGTPADCVRVALLNIMKEKPDVVFSGINFGYNCGSDIKYSGTVAAALEAASFGIPAIAFSEGADGVHEITDDYLHRMIAEHIDRRLPRNQIWNINFPQCKREEFKGILRNRAIAGNAFYRDHYREERISDGHFRYHLDGEYHTEAEEGTDFRASVENYISVGIVKNIDCGLEEDR